MIALGGMDARRARGLAHAYGWAAIDAWAAPARDQRRAEPQRRRAALARLLLGVAVAVTAISAASALRLTGVPDPGPLTTYGAPALTAIGEFAAAIAAAYRAAHTAPQSGPVSAVSPRAPDLGAIAMSCIGTTNIVTCRGGNNAIVYLY